MSLVELNRLINASPLPDQVKRWALRRAPTFKRPSKLLEWTNKFKNLNKERPPIRNISHLKRYAPTYVKVTLNVFQTAHSEKTQTVALGTRSIVDPNQNRWSVEDRMYASENDTEVILPKHFIDTYPKFNRNGMTFLGSSERDFGTFKNVKEFTEAALAVAPEESRDTLTNLSWAAESRDVDGELQLVGVSAIPNQRYDLRPLADRPVRANDRRIAHPWLQYQADLLASSFEEMFTRPKYYYDDGCMYAAIMNCWADEYNDREDGLSKWNGFGRKPLPDMSPETIHAVVHPGSPYDPDHLIPFSFNQMKPFLNKYGVCARLYTSMYQLVEQFPPGGECTHRDGRQKVLCLIVRDDHAHVFYDSGMKQSVTKRLAGESDVRYNSGSTKYYVPSGDAQVYVGKISSIEEIFSVTQDYARASDEKKVDIRLLWNGNDASLLNAVESLISKVDWVPKVNDGKNGRTNSFSLQWMNEKQSVNVTVISPEYGAYGKDVKFYELPLETINEALRVQHELKMCNSRYLMSTYGVGVKELFKAYRFAPPYASFGIQPAGEYDIIDMKRCYTTIVRSFKEFPKFGVYDTIRVYDGHRIKYWSVYSCRFVGERNNEMDIRFPAETNLLFGHQLQPYIGSVEIECFIEPYQLIPNPFLDMLDIIDKSTLPDAVKKGIPLRNWGNWGKLFNKKRYTQLFTTLEDAQCTNLPDKTKEPLGRVVSHNDIHKLIVRDETELTEGFLPLQHLLYTTCRSKLADLVRDAGDEAVGVHTDCVYLKSEPLTSPDHCRIGRAIMNCKPLDVKKVTYDGPGPEEVIRPKVHCFTEQEEWTDGFADQVLSSNLRAIIKALYAGSGKSRVCLQYVQGSGKSFLVACPSNDQAQKLDGGVTYHKLCGYGVDEVTKKDLRINTPLEADIVVCEEVFQLSLSGKKMLWEYMQAHPTTQFIANGDVVQCNPVDTGSWNPSVNQDEYHTRVIDQMFPVQVLLRVPKRWKDPAWIYALKADIDNPEMTRAAIIKKYTKLTTTWDSNATYYAYRRDAVELANEMAHGDQPEYSIGQYLKYTWTTPCPKFGLNQIHKGNKLRIESINDTHLGLLDMNGISHTLELSGIRKNFSYAYASTIHSQQGASVDGKVVLIDYDFHWVDRKWLFVALTRGRDPEQLYRMDVKVNTYKSIILAKIAGHRRTDAARNQVCDLTYEWWVAQSKAQRGLCYLCDTPMTLKKPKRGRDDDLETADRIDSRFWHTQSNCKLCCLSCNRRKKDAVLQG